MTRKNDPEETVKSILDVATKLFLEKGYENTSLLDIMKTLNISKGAIYHHFSSKEKIFEAIYARIGKENSTSLAKIRDDTKLNGYDKLRAIFKTALLSSNQSLMLTVTPNLLENPKFLAKQIEQIYQIVAPEFIEPILKEGISDGSIDSKNPEEIAEVIMVLNNIWLNPLVHTGEINEIEKIKRRCRVYHRLLQGVGIDLFDEEMIEEYVQHYTSKNK